MAKVVVRNADVQDAEALLRLYRQLGSPRTELPSLADATSAIEKMEQHAWLHLLVAEINEEAVGTVTIAIIPSITHNSRPWVQLENMVVDEDHRRAGIGEALIQRCYAISQEAGAYKLQLVNSDWREGAHAFYRRIGFDPGFAGFRKYFE